MAQRIITLGRGSDNTVVLTEANVSTHHARLIVDGSQLVLEDLGSTNGTAVGRIENKISRSVVRPDDIVFLGSTEFQVSDWLSQDKSQSAPFISKPANSDAARHKSSVSRLAVVSAASVGGIVLLVAGFFGIRTLAKTDSELPTASSAAEDPVDRPFVNAAINANDSSTASLRPVGGDSSADRSTEEGTNQDSRSHGLFLIVCADADRKTPFRVGTAFAIDANHVATSGAVAQAMVSLQENGYPHAFLYSPEKKDEWQIVSHRVHPEYSASSQALREAQAEHDRIFDELEANPPDPDSFNEVKDELVEARLKALAAIDRKTACDVATFRIAGTLESWFPLAESASNLRPNQKLQIVGHAFDLEDPFFDATLPFDPIEVSSRVAQVIPPSQQALPRLQGKGIAIQHEMAFLGCPVLNPQGQVVAIYSRPTPPDPGQQASESTSFEAALAERVAETLLAQ